VLIARVRANKVYSKTFPVKLTAWRKAKGLGQKQAADEFEVSFSCYQKWEQGNRTPEKLTMCEIERRMTL
jgi:transcriptional regulator with XRE-family HTH domain